MRLSDLIATVGDDKVQFQNLDQTAISLNYTAGKGTRITFGTEETLTPKGTTKLGLVVWLDREAVATAVAAATADSSDREFDVFHNRLRILASIDLGEAQAAGLHSFSWSLLAKDPRDFFVRTDTETARKVWSIIRARETRSA